MNRKVYGVLVEALRRRSRFAADYASRGRGGITEQWTGLGFKSEYREAVEGGYMVVDGHYEPRCMGWYKLTEKGAAIVQAWLDAGYDHIGVEEGANAKGLGLPPVPPC